MLNQITPLILTFNEGPNLGRTLDRLSWAKDIVIVDSHSTDDTRAIASRYPAVRVFERAFTTHAEQWNFGLQQTGIKTDWVLALDADFMLTDEATREITALSPPPNVNGYRASFTYCIDGKPLRSAVYPPVTVLYRRAHGTYVQDGHTQRVQVDGPVMALASRILHDDRKSLSHWIGSQVKYMRLEADKLAAAPPSSLAGVDRVRQFVVLAPPLMFLHCLFVRGGIFDGWAGLYYALQRATAELILSLSLADRIVRGRPDSRASSH
ncbi:MAG TPA: glycosyltransferase family 2 protein [Vicinamibacterales bacterium]|nr:glycosyltransferase family 2 protein [Vicinamibacterales bacterium]